ncbi:MAG: GtrA family protein [Anaerolineae bacterium]|nr:GtrA family protein [Anaerolineae bacterium]
MLSTETTEEIVKQKGDRLARGFAWWNQMIVRVSQRAGAQRAREVERFLKFATVGILGAIIDFGMLNLLQATILRPTEPNATLKVALATGTAFVTAVSSNFIWNRYWTYPDSRTRSVRRQGLQFFIVSAIGLAFRLVWVRTLYSPFGEIGVDVLGGLGLIGTLEVTATRRLGTNIAQFFAIWIVMVWNFFANRYWTYNDVE